MTKRMTVVFHDEELYTCPKVEAARRHKPASDIVAEAVQVWLEKQEDMELPPIIDAARAEWQKEGDAPGMRWGKSQDELGTWTIASTSTRNSGRTSAATMTVELAGGLCGKAPVRTWLNAG